MAAPRIVSSLSRENAAGRKDNPSRISAHPKMITVILSLPLIRRPFWNTDGFVFLLRPGSTVKISASVT